MIILRENNGLAWKIYIYGAAWRWDIKIFCPDWEEQKAADLLKNFILQAGGRVRVWKVRQRNEGADGCRGGAHWERRHHHYR